MNNFRKITVSLSGLGLLITVIVVVAIAFWSFGKIKDSAKTRRNTFIVLNNAGDFQAALIDAETAQRGYMLTGDAAFLQPYLAVRDSIGGWLVQLRQRTRDSVAAKRLDALVPLVDMKMAAFAHIIEWRRNHKLTAALTNVDSSNGKPLMDKIRAVISGFIGIEHGVLAQHDEEFQSNMRYLFTVIVCASLLVLVLALLFGYSNYREIQQKLKDVETQHLLKMQEDMNQQLQNANSTLQLSEEKLAVTLKSIGDAVMTTDAFGKVTFLNPFAEKLTGWMLAAAKGRPADEIFHIVNEETRNPSVNPVKQALEFGTIQLLANHTILIARDGSECAIADSCAPICNRDGEVVGVVLVFRDVSERRDIENGLEKTRKELAIIKKTADEASEFAESVINTVREPLISLDQDLRVVTASRSFYEFFKVNKEETVGQLIYDLGNKQWDIPKLRELLETILPQKATFDNYEVEHDFFTIGKRIMLLNARQIQRGSEKERIILLAIEDITERKEIENGLELARKDLEALTIELKRAARAKSEFLANMSHELRTPLNSIIGFSEVLFDKTFGPLNDKQLKYVNNVLVSGKHLLLLINQILDTAKVEAGKMHLVLSKLPLKILLNEISLLVEDIVNKKKLQMFLEIDNDLPDIEADELKVKEIIYNLLSNAVKFTPQGGKIGMRARKVDSGVQIEVWDTGIGIAPENMEKVFEGFFRVDTPYSQVTEGTGLGLPLSKKLIELHGGKIYLETEGLNKGTLVRFVLPVVSSSKLA